MCGSKKKHRSWQSAERMIGSLIRNRGEHSLTAYWCPYCGHYHVGHDARTDPDEAPAPTKAPANRKWRWEGEDEIS